MSRIVVRRTSGDAPHPARISLGSAFLGLAAGGGLALLVYQIWQAASEEAWYPGQALPRASSVPAIVAAKSALASDPHLEHSGLSLLAGGRGSIELHGWVADRKDRAQAARLAAAAIAPVELVNCLMVHGEDDAEAFEEDFPADAVSA